MYDVHCQQKLATTHTQGRSLPPNKKKNTINLNEQIEKKIGLAPRYKLETMILRLTFYLIILIASSNIGFSQGFVLIIPDSDCEIIVDGEIKEQGIKGNPKKIELSEGKGFLIKKYCC